VRYLNRRRFLKYAGATAAVVGASALGLDYVRHPIIPSGQPLTTLNQATTTSSIAMPPSITALTYDPTKVVNSKVYDISVNIELSNPSRSMFPVTITLQPVLYSHLPDDAFPKEQPQSCALQTTGLATEVLSTIFADLKGGREYEVKAQIASPAIDERAIRTEYVREFENIAALDDITVIADYYLWYRQGKPPCNGMWRYCKTGESFHVYNPLLGEYDSGDPITIAKHIDWATGHGIDALAFSWWTTGNDGKTDQYFQAENITKFLSNPLMKDIKFCILYENNGRLRTRNISSLDPAESKNDNPLNWIQDFDDEFNRQTLVDDFNFLMQFFENPNYLRINGKPYVRFDYVLPFRGDFEGAFSAMRENIKHKGIELCLACDLVGRSTSPYPKNPGKASDGQVFDESFFRRILSVFDSISASNFPFNYQDVTEESGYVDALFKEWGNYVAKLGKTILPNAWPGHIRSPLLAGKDYVPLRRDPLRLQQDITIGLKYANTIEIQAFNGWEAGIQTEPSVEEGFSYLEAIQKSISRMR
jgi:hypothetical protein